MCLIFNKLRQMDAESTAFLTTIVFPRPDRLAFIHMMLFSQVALTALT